MVLKFDTSYIVSAYSTYFKDLFHYTVPHGKIRFIKYVKWKMYVTQLQPFAQSATFKLLSLSFSSVIFERTSLRPKTLPAMLNKHSTGADDEKNNNSYLAIP